MNPHRFAFVHKSTHHFDPVNWWLVGIAARESIRHNHPVNLNDLVPLAPSATRLSQLI